MNNHDNWNAFAIAGILAALILGGCAGVENLTARTYVSYKDFTYDSHKDQNLDAQAEFHENGQMKKISVKAIAVTPQAAIAAAVEQTRESLAMLRETLAALIALSQKAAPTPVPVK